MIVKIERRENQRVDEEKRPDLFRTVSQTHIPIPGGMFTTLKWLENHKVPTLFIGGERTAHDLRGTIVYFLNEKGQTVDSYNFEKLAKA